MILEKNMFIKKLISFNDCYIEDSFFCSEETQIIMPEKGLVVIGNNGYIVLDFGTEMCGRVHVLLGENLEMGEFRLRLGESVAEACSELGENFSDNSHSLRDCSYPVISHADITSSQTGFRFLRIDAFNCEKLAIKNIYVETNIIDLSVKGSFNCEDEILNDIYNVARETAIRCVQNNVVWDGIKRDRCVWLGDFHPEMLALLQIYGDMPQIQNVLDQIQVFSKRQEWVNKIPVYSAWWIICLVDYYFHTGNKTYVQEKISFVLEILSNFDKVILSDGQIDFNKSQLSYLDDVVSFFSWSTFNKGCSLLGVETIILIACSKATSLFREFNINSILPKTIEERLAKKPLLECLSKEVNAGLFLAGRVGNDQIKKVLLAGGAKDLSCHMGYYIILAALNAGAGDKVLQIIKDFYGGMIKLGATTFWEYFDVEWLIDNPQSIDKMPKDKEKNIHRDYGKYCCSGFRNSLCHGWSSGIVAFYTKNILGVELIGSGYSLINIKPTLLGLQTVEGTIPTPLGEIYVKHVQRGDNKIDSYVRVPNGIKVVNKQECAVEVYG